MSEDASNARQAVGLPMPSSVPPTSRRYWKCLAGVAVLKALLLFVALPLFTSAAPGSYNVEGFPDRYDDIATNLLEGHGYRLNTDTSETMLRTPGFVLILAGIFALVGKSLVAVQVFNLAISLVGGWALYRLALRVTQSENIAIGACVIFLLYPATVLSESRAGVESTFTAAGIVFVLLFYRALQSFAYRDFVLAGVAFGLALLIKSTFALVLPGFFIYVILSRRPHPAFGRVVALFAAGSLAALVVLSPWIVRNYKISGEFIPTNSMGGLVAFQGLWVEKHRSEGKPHWQVLNEAIPEQTRVAQELGLRVRPGFFPQFYAVKDEIRYNDELSRRVRAELLRSPALALRFIGHNFIGFWIQGRTPTATMLNAVLVLPFLLVALAGLMLSIRRGFHIVPITIVILMFFSPHLAILGVARYHTPLVPYLAIFAAVALVALARQVLPASSRWAPAT